METPGVYEIEEKPIQPTPGRCGARTRGGGFCQSWPVQGKRRCRMHGGAEGSGRPPIHGRYSTVLAGALKEKYRGFLLDSDYQNLTCEIAIQRSLFSEYLSRFDGRDIRFRANDIGHLFGWLDGIGRMVERAHRMEVATALTGREIQLLEVTIIRLLSDFLTPEQRAVFGERLAEALGSAGVALPAPRIEVIDAKDR